MGTRPTASLIYGYNIGHYDSDYTEVMTTLALHLNIDTDVDHENDWRSMHDYHEVNRRFEFAESGSWDSGYELILGPKESLFTTDWDSPRSLSVKDLQPKPEWSERLSQIAEAFGIETTPEWHITASYG